MEAIDYQVPLALRAAAVAVFGATGVAVAAAFEVFLGDATWSVSTGERGVGRQLWRRVGCLHVSVSLRASVQRVRRLWVSCFLGQPAGPCCDARRRPPSGPLPGAGLGALLGAAMYEAGRPRRLNVEELQAKEALWQDFRRFADAQLQRRGRCHETEILRALGRAQPRYRGERMLDGLTLRWVEVVGGV